MRTIAIVTVGRSDYGIYRPLLDLLRDAPDLRPLLIVSGAHLSPEHGMTVDEIERDGCEIAARVDMELASDSGRAVAASMGRGTIGFADAYARLVPDVIVVLGDRFETHAAVVAALPFNIPVAHIAGGELTVGAIDDALRHSITKLSHLHFVSTAEYARRVEQLGEEPWRVTVTGTMSVDNARRVEPMSLDEMRDAFGLKIEAPFLLVTYHPVTLEPDDTGRGIGELLAALDASGMPVLFTMPNADRGGLVIREAIERYVAVHDDAQAVESLGMRGYLSAMAHAAAMVGNSSSGIVEAASFALPVVNIGSRQEGRARSRNIIDVGHGREQVAEAIARAISEEFTGSLRGMENPYGDGRAAERIVEVLRSVELGARLLRKRFVDLR